MRGNALPTPIAGQDTHDAHNKAPIRSPTTGAWQCQGNAGPQPTGQCKGSEPRAGLAFLDTKSDRDKWMKCSIPTAIMPTERSRSHETVTQESLREVQSSGGARSAARRGHAGRARLTPRRACQPDRHLAQTIA